MYFYICWTFFLNFLLALNNIRAIGNGDHLIRTKLQLLKNNVLLHLQHQMEDMQSLGKVGMDQNRAKRGVNIGLKYHIIKNHN